MLDTVLFIAGGLLFSNTLMNVIIYVELKRIEAVFEQILQGLSVNHDENEYEPDTNSYI